MTHELENKNSEENYRAQTGYIEEAKVRDNNGAVKNPHSTAGLDAYLSPQHS